MTPEIIQLVEVWDREGDPILELSQKRYLTTEDLSMSADKFNALLTGTKTAKVKREVSETIGGPGYSSVKVSTSIEVTCDQSEKSIKDAAKHCLAECAILNEEAVLGAFEALLDHRKKLKLDE